MEKEITSIDNMINIIKEAYDKHEYVGLLVYNNDYLLPQITIYPKRDKDELIKYIETTFTSTPNMIKSNIENSLILRIESGDGISGIYVNLNFHFYSLMKYGRN